MAPKVLFVFTSVNKNLKGGNTGWYLPEAAHPYYVLAPHVDIDFASPKGPNPPVDHHSVQSFTDDQSVSFLKDDTVKAKLASAKKLKDVNFSAYDAIFYIGGHGPVIDLAVDEDNINLANQFYRAGKITSAVCHGPAALVGVTGSDGKSIFAGRQATGFTNAEEIAVEMVDTIPFLLEDRIKSLGGKFVNAEPWAPKVVVDGNVITGQNPASASAIGEAILKALKA